jgi:hypothetical protein
MIKIFWAEGKLAMNKLEQLCPAAPGKWLVFSEVQRAAIWASALIYSRFSSTKAIRFEFDLNEAGVETCYLFDERLGLDREALVVFWISPAGYLVFAPQQLSTLGDFPGFTDALLSAFGYLDTQVIDFTRRPAPRGNVIPLSA